MHPVRLDLTIRLARELGVLDRVEMITPVPAAREELLTAHTPGYLDALHTAAHDPSYEGHGLGTADDPIFEGMDEVGALIAGGSLLAAQRMWRGDVAHAVNIAGGLHHAMPDYASGFCLVNDPVVAIRWLRANGASRVAYVDIDVHHGDGVQAAFYSDPDVLTISTHERGERLFPGTGFVEEMGEGAGRGYSVNLPLEALTDTSIYLPAFDAVVPPLVQAFRPDVIVAQLGIDSHRTDPLTHLALDVQGFAQAVRRLVGLAPRLVALGGGGYDIVNVARAWTAAWAVMNDLELTAALPEAFREDARRFGAQATSLHDPPHVLDDARRRIVQEYADRQVDAIQRLIFPLHRL
jgi:acetoin utilization protein AcuC